MININHKGLVKFEPCKQVPDSWLNLYFKSPFNDGWMWHTDKVSKDMIEDWLNGTSIQVAMPNLTATEREYFLTGFNDDEQKEVFG